MIKVRWPTLTAACALLASGIIAASAGESVPGRLMAPGIQLASLTANLEQRIQEYRPGQDDEKVYDSRWEDDGSQAARSEDAPSADEVYLEVYLEPNV